MEAIEFWLTLLSGVVIGLLLGMLVRWIGRKLIRGNWKLKTRVFELSTEKYSSFSELAQAMGLSVSQIYRVKEGKRPINEKFIVGAIKAFPGYKLDDLFYVESHNDRQEE